MHNNSSRAVVYEIHLQIEDATFRILNRVMEGISLVNAQLRRRAYSR